jgi:hypothetical protein
MIADRQSGHSLGHWHWRIAAFGNAPLTHCLNAAIDCGNATVADHQ